MKRDEHMKRIVEMSMKIGTILLLVILSFRIIQPMLLICIWGAIIAVGTFPTYEHLTRLLKGRQTLSAVIITGGMALVLILPLGALIVNTGKNAEELAKMMAEGSIVIPPPAENVREFPIIGESVYDLWYMANTNMMELLKYILPHIKSLAPKVLSFAGNLGIGMVQTLISIALAGVFMVYGHGAKSLSDKISKVLLGDYIGDFTQLSVGTIRSVVQGIVGVGVIQGLAAGAGLTLAKVPGAGLITLVTVFLCIVQLPPMLVLVPVAIYLFMNSSLIVAVLFSIWVLVITFGDTPLRALLFGRGLEVPSLVIFVGTMGGVLNWGILGLFIGAVILALGYKFVFVLIEDSIETTAKEESEQ